MRITTIFIAFLFGLSGTVFSQFNFETEKSPFVQESSQDVPETTVTKSVDRGPQYGNSQTQVWEFGASLTASGDCSDVVLVLPVPIECPEQEIRIVNQTIDAMARIRFREFTTGEARLMVISIPQLPQGQTATVSVSFETKRKEILAPKDKTVYSIPDSKKLKKELKPFIESSGSYINVKDRSFIKIFNEETKGKETDWEKIEAIYDYVQKNVKYNDANRAGRSKGASKTLTDKEGDCKDMSALFIGICRAGKVPARIVRIPSHCYAEFYLEDEEGKGYWFPCQLAGTRAFGSMPEFKPVLHKGDRFRIPETAETMNFLGGVMDGKIHGDVKQRKPTFIEKQIK